MEMEALKARTKNYYEALLVDERTVVATMGDGSYLFANPVAGKILLFGGATLVGPFNHDSQIDTFQIVHVAVRAELVGVIKKVADHHLFQLAKERLFQRNMGDRLGVRVDEPHHAARGVARR